MAAGAAVRRAGLVSSAGLTLAARVAAFAFSLATNVVLARSLGPEGRGVYAVAVLVPALIGLVAQLGLGPANVYHFSKGLISGDELVGHAISMGLLLGAVCYIAMFGYVALSGATHVFGVAPVFLLVTCAAIPFTLTTAFLQGVLTGAQRFGLFNATIVSQYASPTIVLVIAMLLSPRSVSAAVAAWTVSGIVTALISVGCVARVAPIVIRLRLSTLRPLLRFGMLSYLGSLTSFVNYRFDVLLVNLFAGARQVGLYAVGTGLAEVVWYLANAAGIVLAPRIAASSEREADQITEGVCRIVTFMALVSGLVLALVAPYVIVLFFGSAFAESTWAVWLLLPGIVTFSVARILSMYLLGRNRLKIDLFASLVGLAVTLALDLILIPRFGFRGAAIASSIAYTSGMLFSLTWVVRHSSISPRGLLVPRPSDGALLARRLRASVLSG
jgi:O-antigen/teichoic acid export membrane protein